MKETISQRRLCELLSEASGISPDKTEKFIDTVFATAADLLEKQNEATLPGIGTFRSDRESGRIIFTPDTSLAAKVNEPFSFFEPVELNVDDSALDDADKTDAAVHEVDQHTESGSDLIALESAASEVIECTETATSVEDEPTAPESCQCADEQSVDVTEEEASCCECEDDEIAYRTRPWPVIAGVVAGLITGIILGLLGHDQLKSLFHDEPNIPAHESQTKTVLPDKDTITVTADDTVKVTAIVEARIPAVVTDTVTSRRFLATMARQYYGVMEYWIYIYEENIDRLPDNPNRITPGTVVVIPPIEKYVADGNRDKGKEDAMRRILQLENKLKAKRPN